MGQHIDMEDAEDAGVRKRVAAAVTAADECHDMSAGAWVNRILTATDVVCCVVDAQDLMEVDTIVLNDDAHSLLD